MNDPKMNPDLTTGSAGLSPTTLGSDSSTGLAAQPASPTSAGNGEDRIHRLAGSMHRAIDSIEQRLSSTGGGMSSTRARYGERLRTRVNEQPLQSAGLVLAAGVLLDRLFLRKPKVRVVKVPVRPPSTSTSSWQAAPLMEARSRRWSDAVSANLQRAGGAGRHAADKAGMAAALGLAGTRAAASNAARDAQALPLRMRVATQRLMARSQEYGSIARSTVEAHPMAGLAAVLTASGLLTAVLMSRRGSRAM